MAQTFDSPELRTTRNLLYGLLVFNCVVYIVLIPLSLYSSIWEAAYSLVAPILYYLIEGPLFVSRIRNEAKDQKKSPVVRRQYYFT